MTDTSYNNLSSPTKVDIARRSKLQSVSNSKIVINSNHKQEAYLYQATFENSNLNIHQISNQSPSGLELITSPAKNIKDFKLNQR